jgi:hypothetical protein
MDHRDGRANAIGGSSPEQNARRLIRVASAIAGLFFTSITLAFAQSPMNAIKEFGLLGIWADDCRSDPSPSNQYASFSINLRGNIQLHNDFGPDYGDMLYRIVDAKPVGRFRISLRQLLTTDDQIALDVVMLRSNDRIRVWSSRGADGAEYVQGGMIPAANNRETSWMQRCDTRSAGNAILADDEESKDARRHLSAQAIRNRLGRAARALFQPGHEWGPTLQTSAPCCIPSGAPSR